MSRDDNLELDELLAGARLAGSEYDEIERRVLAQVAPVSQRRWWPAIGGVAALASAFGAWFLVSPGAITTVESAATPPASFTAKSMESGASIDAPGAGVSVELGCGMQGGACRLGDTLMFSVRGVAQRGYLGAYAVRVNEPGSVPLSPERIWYFPSANGAVPRLEPRVETFVIPEGVRLTAPHAPGRYEVTAWWSEVPPDRNAVALAVSVKSVQIAFEIVD